MSSATEPIRVVVVDDQRLFIYGIQMLIESQPDLVLVGTAADGAEAIQLVAEREPDVVLMDIRMPIMSGLEAAHRITNTASGNRTQIIILTTFQREEAVYLAMKHGASAFITKDATPEFLLESIRTVHRGQAVVSPAETMALIHEFGNAPLKTWDRTEPLRALSPREQEIFLYAARGLSNPDIARAAFISESTTKSHIRSILAKLDLQSRVQIVVYAYENGLVTL